MEEIRYKKRKAEGFEVIVSDNDNVEFPPTKILGLSSRRKWPWEDATITLAVLVVVMDADVDANQALLLSRRRLRRPTRQPVLADRALLSGS